VPYNGPSFAAPKQHMLKEWGSLDTSANRQAIKETDFAWLENWIQVGNANLRSIDGPSSILGTTSGGDTIYAMFDANIGGNDTIICLCFNGNGYTFATATNTLTQFATSKFDHSNGAVAQWQNTTALIIGPTGGYWSWNGTTLVDLNTAFTITGTTTLTNLLTVTASPAGFILTPGMTFTGAGITGSITIISFGTGNGGNGTLNSANGTYNVSTTANVGPITLNVTQTAPTAGTAIATYAGRVWIANGRTIYYSAPGSYTDFTVSDAGGALTVSDSSLYGSITGMTVSNNYLYFFGLDSINIIGDVRVGTASQIVGGTASTVTVTLFTNTNITSNIGIPSQAAPSAAGYLRSLVFMTNRGPHILAGASPQKMGPNLDGIVPYIDFTKPVVCGVAQVNFGSNSPGPAANIVMFGFNYKDPLLAITRYIFACFYDGKWLLASNYLAINPVVNLTYAVQAFYTGVPTMYGTDGTHIYQLFNNDLNQPRCQIKTALWHQGDPTIDKQVMRLGVEATYPQGNASFNVTVDTENNSTNVTLSNQNIDTWTTALGVVATWLTAGGQVSVWTAPNYRSLYSDASNIGKYYGFTVTSQTNDVVVQGILSEFIERARW